MTSPPATASLRQRLVSLERILTRSTQPLAELGALGDPHDLHTLFYLQLCTTVRRGPAAGPLEGLAPHRILSVAQMAAEAGILRLSTPPALRQCLHNLETRLVQAGAWHPDEPLWWRPLPEPAPLEELWRAWQETTGSPLNLPSGEQIRPVFADRRVFADRCVFTDARTTSGPVARLHLPSLFKISLARQLYQEVTAAYSEGTLALTQGGVGASDRISVSRSDWIGFFSGMEPTLLQAAPAGRTGMMELLSSISARAGLPSTSGAWGRAALPPSALA